MSTSTDPATIKTSRSAVDVDLSTPEGVREALALTVMEVALFTQSRADWEAWAGCRWPGDAYERTMRVQLAQLHARVERLPTPFLNPTTIEASFGPIAIGDRVRVAIPAGRLGKWSRDTAGVLQGAVGTVTVIRAPQSFSNGERGHTIVSVARLVVEFDTPLPLPSGTRTDIGSHWFDVDEVERP